MIFYILFGVRSNDINAKPKLMKKEFYDKIEIISKDWFIDGEIMLNLNKLNYKFEEIPISFHKRDKGKSKVKLLASFEFLKNMIKYRFGIWGK